MNQCRKGDQGLKQFLKAGQVNITYEDLCAFVSASRHVDTPQVSLQLRRKLTYDLIGHNFFVVTLFTIASVCVKHPIFLQFLVPPENVGSVSQVIDYFNSVVWAGVCAFSSTGRSFADFCCFLDHVKSWNAQSGRISTESLYGELMMFVSTTDRNNHKLSVGNLDQIKTVQNSSVVPIAASLSAVQTIKTTGAKTLAIFEGQESKHDSRSFSTSFSDQSGEKKDVVYLPSGKALLGRNQKPILRSDLSFRADCGILIGPDSMTIFDEDGRPFTKRKLLVAADGKPALNEHHRLQKIEYEQVAQTKVTAKKVNNLLALMDAPVDIFAGQDGLPVTKSEVRDEHHMLARDSESEIYARKEVAHDNLSDLFACSEELFPKISFPPLTRSVAADSKPGLKEHHRLQKVEHEKQKNVRAEKVDNLFSIFDSPVDIFAGTSVTNSGVMNEHHTYAREVESENFVRKEVAKLNAAADSKSPSKEHRRPQKMEYEKQKKARPDTVDNLFANLDAPVDIFASEPVTNSGSIEEHHTLVCESQSKNFVRKEVAQDNLSDAFGFEKLFPVSGTENIRKSHHKSVLKHEF